MLFDMKNPDFGDFSIIPPVVAKDETKDSAIIKQRGDINYYSVFEPEQIHILSSKADIQGFKDFLNTEKFQTAQTPTFKVNVGHLDMVASQILWDAGEFTRFVAGKLDTNAFVKEVLESEDVNPEFRNHFEYVKNEWFKGSNLFKLSEAKDDDSDTLETKVGDDVKTGFEEIQPEESTSPTILQIITRAPSPEALPKNACFIINGEEMVNLTSPLIKVGRRTSNDIVIKDPLVSRDHLQLRAQHGHYLLFDLSSTGGTYINNRQVKSATLKPGDVVRIGKTILIYNQDHAQHSTSTNILNVFPGDPK